MAKNWVYIVECTDRTLYTGYTTNPDRRLREHNTGRGAKYTRGRTPVRFVYLELCRSRSTAQRREVAIKAMPRLAKLLLVRKRDTAYARSV